MQHPEVLKQADIAGYSVPVILSYSVEERNMFYFEGETRRTEKVQMKTSYVIKSNHLKNT